MPSDFNCECIPKDRAHWVVQQRQCNHSAFNGYHRTASAYSSVWCTRCKRRWRTKAAYVRTLPDEETALTPDEVLARVRHAGKTGNFRMATSHTAEEYAVEIKQILMALGASEKRADSAFISDISAICDLSSESFLGDKTEAEWLATAAKKLGFEFGRGEYIVTIARRMREKANA